MNQKLKFRFYNEKFYQILHNFNSHNGINVTGIVEFLKTIPGVLLLKSLGVF